MPRRIQLADVADGITGHVIRDTPWDKIWPLRAIARGVRDGLGTEYRFDLMTGVVVPASRELTRLAATLRSDLLRHLQARHISADWVRSASVTVVVDSPQVTSRPSPVICRAEITDDLGREHTSTRNGTTAAPIVRATLRSRLFERLLPSR